MAPGKCLIDTGQDGGFFIVTTLKILLSHLLLALGE